METEPIPTQAAPTIGQLAQKRRHSTQWAAQFAVASELCKRGYEVSFTQGNATPLADLMCVSPIRKEMFLIDVKGLRAATVWLVKDKPLRSGLFYVLAHVPEGRSNRYFVLPQAEVNRLLAEYRTSGVTYRETHPSGFNWTAPSSYEGRWDLLPQ